MDPLTAFGLSANVFQVVNFSIDLVSHGYRIYKASDGTLGEFGDVEKLTGDLQSCNTLLLDYLHRIDVVQPGPVASDSSTTLGSSLPLRSPSQLSSATTLGGNEPPRKAHDFANPDEQALADLCRDCNRIAQTLLRKLEKVKLRPGSSKREWKAASQAFRVAWDRSEIDSINSRLRQYREQLNTRLLLMVRDRLDRSAQQHDGRLETLEQSARRILSTLMENRNDVATDVSALATRLSRLIIAENEKTRDLLTSTLLQISRSSMLDVAQQQQPNDESWVAISRANTPSLAPVVSLHEAATSGSLQQVRKILRNPRQNVDELDESGCSALHLACMNKRIDIAKYLLQKGADVDQDDDTGSTPLHYAVQSGDSGFVRFLLARHANRDFENDDGHRPFYYAKDNFLLDWMRRFGHSVDAVDPVSGFTALIEAAKEGDGKSLKALIDQGADLRIQCPAKNTALHYACESGDLECIDLLISNGSKLDVANNTGCTPLIVATMEGNLAAVEHLVAARAELEARGTDEGFTPLIAAIHDKRSDIARFLIDQGASIDARDDNGYSPMNRAAQAGLLDIVQLLLDHGIEANDVNPKSGTCTISEAAWHNFPDIVDLLAGLGADLEKLRDGNRDTPLQKASINGSTECVRLLLKHGAKPNVQNYWDWTPLHDAAVRGHSDIVKMLLEAGAETETRMSKGEGSNTALHKAVQDGHTEVVRLLLAHGAKPDAQNKDGWTALAEASHYGHTEILEMLLKAGADTEIKDAMGSTPLHKAVRGGHGDCVRILREYGANPQYEKPLE
ncbi:hypothetical protein N0V90_004721 [Kalmusia sp. IMI 367209]|nr:hypothetical protein N0V90_004721 [Kalmusia sp. IMI 367209]